MPRYNRVPDTYIRKLATKKGLKTRGVQMLAMIEALEKKGHEEDLEYLNHQFQFAEGTSSLTICKPDDQFPTKSSTADKFLETLVEEKWVKAEQLGTEWKPALKDTIQLCGVFRDGNEVFIKMVVAQEQNRRVNYDTEVVRFAKYASAIIHFNDEVIEIRCGFSDRDDYTKFLMKMMGFGQRKWHSLTQVTKKEAQSIAAMLKGDLASAQIAIPSNVGSMRFNAKRGVDMRNDPAFLKMKAAIESVGFPTDDTMDETCNFDYPDPQTGVIIPVSIVINLKKGGLRFKGVVTQSAIEHVLEAFVKVLYVTRGGNFFKEAAPTQQNAPQQTDDDIEEDDQE